MFEFVKTLVLPAAVAARATLLGYCPQSAASKSASFPPRISHLIEAVAKQAGLPSLVQTHATSQDLVGVCLPRFLGQALPPQPAWSPFACVPKPLHGSQPLTSGGRGGTSSLISAEEIFCFLSDPCSGAPPKDNINIAGDAPVAVTPPPHPLLPQLKANCLLRASLPFRCALVTYYSERQVALLYVIQGSLRKSDSLLPANLHYLGMPGTVPTNATSQPPLAADPLGEWRDIRNACKISALSRFPVPRPVGEDELVMPGEFVTVQLQCAAAATAATPATSKSRSKAKGYIPPPAPNLCIFRTMPVWTVCGKFPSLAKGAGVCGDADRSISSVDSLFPRPAAVLQWRLSDVYPLQGSHSSDTGASAVSVAPSSTSVTMRIEADGFCDEGRLKGGQLAFYSCTLVDGEHCGVAHFEHGLDASGANMVCLNMRKASVPAVEVTFDTHVHLLAPPRCRPPSAPPVDSTVIGDVTEQSISQIPERRAVMILVSGKAVVVQMAVVMRKLSFLMATAREAIAAEAATAHHGAGKLFSDPASAVRTQSRLGALLDVDNGNANVPPPFHSRAPFPWHSGVSVACKEERAVEADPFPLATDLCRAAAGLEASYEIPLSLLQELSILPLIDGTSRSSRMAAMIHDGPPLLDTLKHPTPPQPIEISDDYLFNSDAVTTARPWRHEQLGRPVGVWLLLSWIYDMRCHAASTAANGDNPDVAKEAAAAVYSAGEALAQLSRWSSYAATQLSTTRRCMVGRAVEMPSDDVFFLGARGPSYLPHFSIHTRQLFAKSICKQLAFQTLWRCVLPQLRARWGQALSQWEVRECLAWLDALQAAWESVGDSSAVHPNYRACCHVLLASPSTASKPTAERLLQRVIRDLSTGFTDGGQDEHLVMNVSLSLRTIGAYVLPFPNSHTVANKRASAVVTEGVIARLLHWFNGAGGVRVLETPFQLPPIPLSYSGELRAAIERARVQDFQGFTSVLAPAGYTAAIHELLSNDRVPSRISSTTSLSLCQRKSHIAVVSVLGLYTYQMSRIRVLASPPPSAAADTNLHPIGSGDRRRPQVGALQPYIAAIVAEYLP